MFHPNGDYRAPWAPKIRVFVNLYKPDPSPYSPFYLSLSIISKSISVPVLFYSVNMQIREKNGGKNARIFCKGLYEPMYVLYIHLPAFTILFSDPNHHALHIYILECIYNAVLPLFAQAIHHSVPGLNTYIF